MHKNPIWRAFLLLVLVATLGFGGRTLWTCWKYCSYRARIAVEEVHAWRVLEFRSQYLLAFDVSYGWDGTQYRKELLLRKIPYKNRWAAENEGPRRSEGLDHVWINPDKPEDAVLERIFPLGSVVSSLSLIALLIYFLWLGYYVGALNEGSR